MLGDILHSAPLDIELALNLVGGPVSCQSIAIDDYRREHCGTMELQVDESGIKLLQPLISDGTWTLPVALAVLPKN